ncbi:MAG TPA: shikimate kinase [Bacilli bacterium]|uniref:Shikimate kinase n=1 Tax=Amphibacillus indicireducens TaxID=1076330 RepID=A0ABP7VFE6_9BACI|nr:shikimate kinase [Bacilli bacterium]
MKSIFLVGFMGSGKSTIGKQLAKKLKLNYLDTDDLIEQTANKKIKTIFAEDGENVFRDLEHQVLTSTSDLGYVISTGGGIVERQENRAWLSTKQVVYLKTSWETINERLQADQDRPIWQDQSRDKQLLLTKRDSLYRDIAKITIETDNQGVDQIVDQIYSIFE